VLGRWLNPRPGANSTAPPTALLSYCLRDARNGNAAYHMRDREVFQRNLAHAPAAIHYGLYSIRGPGDGALSRAGNRELTTSVILHFESFQLGFHAARSGRHALTAFAAARIMPSFTNRR